MSSGKKVQEFSQSKKLPNNKRQIDLLFGRLRYRLASKGPKAFLCLLKVLKSLDLDSDGLLTFYEFKKAIRDARLEVTDFELDLLFSTFSGASNSVSYWEFFCEIEGEMNENRIKLVSHTFDKIDTDHDGIINVIIGLIKVTDIGLSFCARVHPDVKNGKKHEDNILQELIDSLELHKGLNGAIGDQSFTKQEFIDFYHHYSAVIEDDLFFESILTNCYKLTQNSQVTNSYAGMAGGRKNYETFHKASYLQDHHKHLYYGGSVTSNAPYGTFEDKTNYSTQQRADTNTQDNKAAGTPSLLLRDLQSSSVYSADDAFQTLKSKIQARGINGLLQFKRSLLNQGVQFMDIEAYVDFIKNIRIDLPKNLLYKIFGAYKDEDKDKIDSVVLWKKLLGSINPSRNQEVYDVFDILDKDRDGFIVFEDLKDVLSGKENEDENYTNFIDYFQTHLILMKFDDSLRDKTVSAEEFSEFYLIIGSLIPSNEQFSKVLKNPWQI